jgi:hypothetical protein
MPRARTYAAAIGAFAVLATAAAARAEQPLSLVVSQPTDIFAQHATPDQNRWGLHLDMVEPVGRDLQLRDLQAGAFFKLTPSLRVGGAVAFADQPTQPDRSSLPTTQTPRVRLETTFKF